MSQSIAIRTPDGSFQTYVAFPDVLPAPTIVVIQEITP
jgi:hypothetical protein